MSRKVKKKEKERTREIGKEEGRLIHVHKERGENEKELRT